MRLLLTSLAALALTLPLAAQYGRPDNAPKVGDPIPKVSAVTLLDGEKVDLSQPKRVTVLIFGSHT